MKTLFKIIIILTVATGCDFFENTDFRIINESSKAIIIKTNIDPYDHGVRLIDSIHSVPKGGLIEFYQDRQFSAREQVGTYALTVTDELLERL